MPRDEKRRYAKRGAQTRAAAREDRVLLRSEPHEVSDEIAPACPACPDGGYAIALGSLGRRTHYRCRCCGIDFSQATT